MGVLQKTLFSFEEIYELESKDQLEQYFFTLDGIIGNPSRKTGVREPKDIPFRPLLKAHLVMKIFSIKSVVLLRDRLEHDLIVPPVIQWFIGEIPSFDVHIF